MLECSIDLQCEALSKAKNSHQKTSNGRAFLSVVTYTCKPPFKLRGSSKRTCRATGKWDGRKARCSEYLYGIKTLFKSDTFILIGWKGNITIMSVTLTMSFHKSLLGYLLMFFFFLRSFVPSLFHCFGALCFVPSLLLWPLYASMLQSSVTSLLRRVVASSLCRFVALFLCSFVYKLALSFRNHVQRPRRNFFRKQTSGGPTSREVYSVLVFW